MSSFSVSCGRSKEIKLHLFPCATCRNSLVGADMGSNLGIFNGLGAWLHQPAAGGDKTLPDLDD